MHMNMSLSNYADFMVKCGPINEITRLGKLHERAVKMIDNKQHHELTVNSLMNLYSIYNHRAKGKMCSII